MLEFVSIAVVLIFLVLALFYLYGEENNIMLVFCKLGLHKWVEIYAGENSNIRHQECSRCGLKTEEKVSQEKWAWIFQLGEKRNSYLELQTALRQVLSTGDKFTITNNYIDSQVSVIEKFLPETNVKIYSLSFEGKNLFFLS